MFVTLWLICLTNIPVDVVTFWRLWLCEKLKDIKEK